MARQDHTTIVAKRRAISAPLTLTLVWGAENKLAKPFVGATEYRYAYGADDARVMKTAVTVGGNSIMPEQAATRRRAE